MSSAPATEGIRITSGRQGFTCPPFAAANQHGHVTMTDPHSPMIIMSQDERDHEGGQGGGAFFEDDNQEYTAMNLVGTLTSQQSSRTAAQQQSH